MDERKQCPFCGWKKSRLMSRKVPGRNRVRYIEEYRLVTHERQYYVRCNRCYAHGGIVSGHVVLSFVKAIPKSWHDDEHLIIDPIEVEKEETQPELPTWVKTLGQLKEKATDLWNMRMEDGDG